MIAGGDKVVTRFTGGGTQQGHPPNWQTMMVTGIDIIRIAGGKFVEHWAVTDNLGMMQQFGVIPAPGQAS
jgi:predicted ester cyclase